MFSLVKELTERKRFKERTQNERRERARRESNNIPTFNKHHFTRTKFVITRDIRLCLDKHPKQRTTEEKSSLNPLLKLLDNVHKNDDIVKDGLASSMKLQTINEFEYFDKDFDLMYIVNGTLEITYDQKVSNSESFFQPNFVYIRVSGDYIGDLNSTDVKPNSVYAREDCQAIIVNLDELRCAVGDVRRQDGEDKWEFIEKWKWLGRDRHKLLPLMTRVELQPNRILIRQNDPRTEFIHLIANGRCQVYKDVHFPECELNIVFRLHKLEEGGLVGAADTYQCDRAVCSVVTIGNVVCYKMKREHIIASEHPHLYERVFSTSGGTASGTAASPVPREHELREFAYNHVMWQEFKWKQNPARAKSAPLTSSLDVEKCRGMVRNIQIERDWDQQSYMRFLDDQNHRQDAPPSTRPGTERCRTENDRTRTGSLAAMSRTNSQHLLPNLNNVNKHGYLRKLAQYYKDLLVEEANTNVKGKIGPLHDARELIRTVKPASDRLHQVRERWTFVRETLDYRINMVRESPNIVDTKHLIQQTQTEARQHFDRAQEMRETPRETDTSRSVIHEERDRAVTQLAFHKYRVQLLKRQLSACRQNRSKHTNALVQ